MKKLIVIITIIISLIFLGKYVIEEKYLNYEKPNEKNIKNEENKKVEHTEETEKKEIKKEDIDKESKRIKRKIILKRDSYAQKWLIQEWDAFFENNQLVLALRSYNKALKKTPWDINLIKKIWNTYFEMKKYETSLKYYKELIWTNEAENEKIILSYIYSINFENNLDISNIFKNIDELKVNSEDSFFYKTSIKCLIDRNKCISSFEEYIEKWKWNNNKNINYVKKWLENYKNLQTQKEYFKHTQVLAAIFQSKLYPISNILWDKILEKQDWYLPVLKIVAKWYYELWNYKKAKEYLKRFDKIDSKDPNVNYLLWIINIKLHEYILSNIFFNKALKLWYSPKANVSRRLIYNFYLIWNEEKMMSEFVNLIENTKNINETDYSLAIYYSLINWKTIQANKWINKALKLYPKNDNFYWYKWWVYKEAWEYDNAKRYLLLWYNINKKNPLINLNLWIVNMESWNLLKAKIYFKNTITQDSKWDFWKLASEYLAKIKLEQEKIEKALEAEVGDF